MIKDNPASTTPVQSRPADRLGVQHLLGLTTAIAISFALIQLIKQLRFAADNWYYGLTASPITRSDVILAFVYGTGLALSIFAIRSGRIWHSPGKVIAIILGSACVIHWGLDLATACVMKVRFIDSESVKSLYTQGEADDRGYILGTWYENVSIFYGYILAVPILVFVLFRESKQRTVWIAAWAAIFAFVLACIGRLYFGLDQLLPASLRRFYFTVCVSIPIIAVLCAFLHDFIWHRERLDWWTVSCVAVMTLGVGTIGIIAMI